jgi:hypothetical protein
VLSFIGFLIRLAFFTLLLIPFLGPPLYVEVAGRNASGTVVAKREMISFTGDTWTRRMNADVRFRAAGQDEPETVAVALDAARYDGLHAGDAVGLRYAPNDFLRKLGPLTVARLDTQPVLGSFLAQIGKQFGGLAAGIGGWLVLLWAWSNWRLGWLALLLGLGMVFGAAYLASGLPPPEPSGPLLAGQARVGASKNITRIWQSRRSRGEQAAQPYTIVELSFVPQGTRDPVVAVDTFDTNSVAALERGADVPIHYSAADPRQAQIDGATRTYYWKNLTSFGILIVGIGGLLLLGWWRLRRRAARSTVVGS